MDTNFFFFLCFFYFCFARLFLIIVGKVRIDWQLGQWCEPVTEGEVSSDHEETFFNKEREISWHVSRVTVL